MDLQWEHIGYERNPDGSAAYDRQLWRCPVCRVCKDLSRPQQKHAADCRLHGLLDEFAGRTRKYFLSTVEEQKRNVLKTERDGVGGGGSNGGSNGGSGGRGGGPGGPGSNVTGGGSGVGNVESGGTNVRVPGGRREPAELEVRRDGKGVRVAKEADVDLRVERGKDGMINDVMGGNGSVRCVSK